MRIDPESRERLDLYRLMISIVVPRPIAWVSTRSPGGALNAAPFSYFQAVSTAPPILMIAVGRKAKGALKDTRVNIEATGEFVVNIVSERSAERMVKTSAGLDYEESEFELAGIEPAPSARVQPPRIAESPVSLECVLEKILPMGASDVIFGRIVEFHVDDAVLDNDGLVDPAKLHPLGRLGGNNYAPVREIWEVAPPNQEWPTRKSPVSEPEDGA